MKTYISHPHLSWRVGVECNNKIFNTHLMELFYLFDIERNIDPYPVPTIKLIECGNQFRIIGTDIVCDDIYHALGTIMEILISPYFLKSETHLFLHGAALAKGDKLILIIAPTQQGKSTTTAMLNMKGYSYLSDDVIPINIKNLEVVTFPKVLCIRDIAIIEKFEHKIPDYFHKKKFEVKNLNNLDKFLESRIPLIPKKAISTSENISFEIDRIFFLERNGELEQDNYTLKQENHNTGFFNLIKNLRSPEQVEIFRKIGNLITKKAEFYKVSYMNGYRYLQAFEGIDNDGKCIFS